MPASSPPDNLRKGNEAGFFTFSVSFLEFGKVFAIFAPFFETFLIKLPITNLNHQKMKKLALALMCLVSVAFFASCNPEGQPSIQVLNQEGFVQDGDVVDLNTEVHFGFKVASSPTSNKALASLVVKIDGTEWANKDLTGLYTYTFEDVVTYQPSRDEIVGSSMITAVVTDAAGQIATATINLDINEPTQPLLVTTFEWIRHGADAVTGGIENVGLKWTRNLKDVNAVLEPIDSSIPFCAFTADEWEKVVTQADKENSFAELGNYSLISDFRGVSAFQSNDYDYVLGTFYNGKYNLIHITKGVVTTFKGTEVRIQGEIK